MKRLCFYFIVFLSLQSCEDVVDVDLNTEEPRLVIEATGIQKEQGSTGLFRVNLSETAPYFQETIPQVSDAEVILKVDGNTINIPKSNENPGVYENTIPMIEDKEYKLIVKVDGETYQGKTELYKTVPIDYIEQEEGIFDKDLTLLKIFYTDPANEENYYLFTYLSKQGKDLTLSDDEFYNGQQISTMYMEDFDPGDSITIRIDGTGKDFNRYFSILLDQGNSGNPFATAPGTVRGNMVNINHNDNFALGYFRISQEYEVVYVVE